jgi:DNA-directed RNA polymerase specialized sigma24 family protein
VPPETFAQFDTTAWTLLGQLRADDPAARDAALRSIVSRYWPPVYTAVRAMGRKPEDAAEVTQAFFADVVLGRKLLDSAQQSRGRLRALLLSALKRFMIDLHRQQRARGGDAVVGWDAFQQEEQRLATHPGPGDPEAAFNRRWAAALLQEALDRCERHFTEAGRAGHWALFHARVIAPSVHACEPQPLAQLAERLGFAGPLEAGAALQVVKKRAVVLLREVVGETAEEEQEDELRYVMELLE